MFKQHRVRKESAGFCYLGGFGTNIGKRNVENLDPVNYPNVSFAIANTDSRHLNYVFGEKGGARVEEWTEARRLEEIQIGGSEVTDGDGTGADIEVGFRAARTEATYSKLERYLRSNTMALVIAGLGKGTGTSASQVVAEICQKINESEDNDERKIFMAVVGMPKGTSGQAEIAIPARENIVAMMPTVTVYNSKIPAFAKSLGPEKEKAFTLQDANDGIYREVVKPLTDIFVENTERVGEIASDRNDMKTALKCGHHGYVRDLELPPEELRTLSPEMACQQLFTANFQEVNVAKSGEIAMLWCVGYPLLLVEELQDKIREAATEYNPSKQNNMRILLSYREKLEPGEKGRIILLVVAQQVRSSADEVVPVIKVKDGKKAPLRKVVEDEFALSLDSSIFEPGVNGTEIPPAVVLAIPPQGVMERMRNRIAGRTPITFKVDGKETTMRVPDNLAERYNNLVRLGKKAKLEDWKDVQAAVFSSTTKELDIPAEVDSSVKDVAIH